MRKLIEDYYYEELEVSLSDFICFQNSRSSLYEIKTWIGEAKFNEMLNLFAGSYILIPPAKNLISSLYDYMAALAVARIKIARKNKDLRKWSEQETVLHRIAKKTKRTYSYVQARGAGTLRKIEKIKEWTKKMAIWDKKFLDSGNEEAS